MEMEGQRKKLKSQRMLSSENKIMLTVTHLTLIQKRVPIKLLFLKKKNLVEKIPTLCRRRELQKREKDGGVEKMTMM